MRPRCVQLVACRLALCAVRALADDVYGATDEYGYKAIENRCEIHDLHATLLHLWASITSGSPIASAAAIFV